MEDEILTEFVTQTRADAALAHDLLEAAEWNLDHALHMYEGFMNTQAVQPEDQITPDMYAVPHAGDSPDMEEVGEGEGEEEERERGDTLEVLDGSFETRRDLLRQKRKERSARGLSFLADDIVDKFHKVAISKYRTPSEEQTVIDDHFFRHSFVYPDFSSLALNVQEFIAADLIDISLRNPLENNHRLNWWTQTGKFPRLEPLATSGDGNCLLHAASLYMWGFHDRFLILRTSMHRLLTQGRERAGIQSRWRYQTQLRNDDAGGLTFSEEEWQFEWSEVVRIATNRPRCDQSSVAAAVRRKSTLRLSYEYLEEIHIFALAHVTQRPIIVIADTVLKGVSGEDLSPIYFGGVYLPLEMNPTACHKSPVVLAYDAAHFSALVAKEERPQSQVGLKPTNMPHSRSDRKREEPVIPLVGPDGKLLPIQFVYDPNNPTIPEKWGRMKYEQGEFPPALIQLLENYLNVRWVRLPIISPSSPPESATDEDYDHLAAVTTTETLRCPAAQLTQESQPVYQKDLIDKYLENVHVRFEEERQRCQRVAEERERQARLEEEAKLRQPVPCKGLDCDMYGTASTDGLCSMCFQKRSTNNQDEEIEKEDLGRELDSETVELYMPHIEEHPPSYKHVTEGKWEGQEQGTTEDRRDHETTEGGSGILSNGLSNSASSEATSKRDPSPQLIPVTIPSTGGNMQESSSSSSTSVQSFASNGSTGDKSRSPKRNRAGWIKKLQALPAGLRTGSKPKKSTTGYTRDNIQPVTFTETQSEPISSQSSKTRCSNAGCEFFSDSNCNGYCSTCYKAQQTMQTI